MCGGLGLDSSKGSAAKTLPLRMFPVWVVGVLLLRVFQRLSGARQAFRLLFLRFAMTLVVALKLFALFSS